MDTEKKEIANILSSINDAWTQGDADRLSAYFHERMVVAGPDATKMGTGREECVRSYREFIDNAHIARFRADEPAIDVWDNTALAFYEFEIVYNMDGKEYHEVGRDVFAFTRSGGDSHWQAVWRMLIPIDAHNEENGAHPHE